MGWWEGSFIHFPCHPTGGLFDIVAAAFGGPGSFEFTWGLEPPLVNNRCAPHRKTPQGEKGQFLKTGRGQDFPNCQLQDPPAVPKAPGLLQDSPGPGRVRRILAGVRARLGGNGYGGRSPKVLEILCDDRMRIQYNARTYNTLAVIAYSTLALIACSAPAHAIHTL